MADGNDRPKQKQQQTAGYALHPYYYHPYFASPQLAGAGYVPMVAHGAQQAVAGAPAYGWPAYAGGYVAAMQMAQGAGGQAAAYYFPYAHPAYAQYAYQVAAQQPQQGAESSTTPESNEDASGVEKSVPSPLEAMEPIGGGLVRKVSKGFSKDKSKWRLSRQSSKPSLALDGTGGDANEDWSLPSSPMMGRKQSYSVSPRGCGSAFLPDKEVLEPFTRSELHLVEALRIMSGEIGRPSSDKAKMRLSRLEEAAVVEMRVVSKESRGEVIGLQNPLNSKICYLNSLVQILIPITPLMEVLSLALTQGSAGVWSCALCRIFRTFFKPPIGQIPSLLTVKGMDKILRDLGGVGTQQDVAEALGVVLNKVHEEWKHSLRRQLWLPVEGGDRSNTPSNHGLEEDSIVYKLFRGIRCANSQLEIFTQIHLASPTGSSCMLNLVDLLQSTLQGELHYLPPVLCIELSRHLSENQLTTSQTSVPFSGSMKIPSSCRTSGCNERNYQLVGAVVRSGVYANSGHFWAAQRRGDEWFWINDTEVTPCNVSLEDQSDEMGGLISKKLEATSNWCLLVYADPNASVAIHPYN